MEKVKFSLRRQPIGGGIVRAWQDLTAAHFIRVARNSPTLRNALGELMQNPDGQYIFKNKVYEYTITKHTTGSKGTTQDGIRKLLSFFGNYPRPAEWIEYIADGDKNLTEHYTRKWYELCDCNASIAGAIIDFVHDLDSVHENRFIQYIAEKFQ